MIIFWKMDKMKQVVTEMCSSSACDLDKIGQKSWWRRLWRPSADTGQINLSGLLDRTVWSLRLFLGWYQDFPGQWYSCCLCGQLLIQCSQQQCTQQYVALRLCVAWNIDLHMRRFDLKDFERSHWAEFLRQEHFPGEVLVAPLVVLYDINKYANTFS